MPPGTAAVPLLAQCTASPSSALVKLTAPPLAAVAALTEFWFSSTNPVVDTAPTSQPARVNGTHGAGALTALLPEPAVISTGVLESSDGLVLSVPLPPTSRP